MSVLRPSDKYASMMSNSVSVPGRHTRLQAMMSMSLPVLRPQTWHASARICTSLRLHAADWLWLHAPARAAFLAWRSPRDGATAAAVVLRVWCRAGGPDGPCAATASAPDSSPEAPAPVACSSCSQGSAACPEFKAEMQYGASGLGSAAGPGALTASIGSACGRSSAEAAGLASEAVGEAAAAGSGRVSDTEVLGCRACAEPGMGHEPRRPWAMELAAAAAALTHLGPDRRCALAASSSISLLHIVRTAFLLGPAS